MYSAIERAARIALRWWWWWSLALPACGADTALTEMEARAESCFVGDVSKPLEFDVVYRTAEGELKSTEDRSEVPLIQPPQGGKVLFVGIRARNINGCGVTLATALCEPEGGEVLSLERRPVTLELAADGWMIPERPSEASNYSNLPACPRADLTRSVANELYELRVSITDRDGRKAGTSLQVIPTCGEPERSELCECECSKDYKLGRSCSQAPEAAP
jgi:hypothetical protein